MRPRSGQKCSVLKSGVGAMGGLNQCNYFAYSGASGRSNFCPVISVDLHITL